MTRASILIFSLLLWPPMTIFGFSSSWIPGTESCPPELHRYTQGQTDTLLGTRMNIGLKVDSPMFVIDGFQFQLCNTPIINDNPNENKDGHHIKIPLPGADGPRPQISSGVFHLEVVKDGSFINMEGLQTVEFSNGCWEMIWRDGAAAGLIICGLSLTHDARRNDLVLEKGNVYITFPVWSKEGLISQQARKLEVQAKYKEFEIERDSQLEKMANTPNILKKALHFRNAVAATENMDNTGLHRLLDIPSNNDVMEIGEELQLVRTGTVWTKSGPFRSNHQQLLGSATLASP